MTREELIQSLRCCASDGLICARDCPAYQQSNECNCADRIKMLAAAMLEQDGADNNAGSKTTGETFRERVTREHPEKVSDCACGGVLGCPHTYGYEDGCPYAGDHRDLEICCRECWDRVIPGGFQTSIKKEIPCPVCKSQASITYEENRLYKLQCQNCGFEMTHTNKSWADAQKFFEGVG